MVGALLNILVYDMINVLSSQSREAKTFLLFKSPFVRSKFRISNNLSSFDINPHIYLTDPFTRGVKGEVIPSCLAHQYPWKKLIDTLIFLLAEAIKGRQDLRLTVRCDQLCLLTIRSQDYLSSISLERIKGYLIFSAWSQSSREASI